MNRYPSEFTDELLHNRSAAGPDFRTALDSGQHFHLRIHNPPYTDLTIETLPYDPPQVSIAHYTIINGDACQDPEFVLTLDGTVLELTQFPSTYARFSPTDPDRSGVIELADMWANNIRAQGFLDATRNLQWTSLTPPPMVESI